MVIFVCQSLSPVLHYKLHCTKFTHLSKQDRLKLKAMFFINRLGEKTCNKYDKILIFLLCTQVAQDKGKNAKNPRDKAKGTKDTLQKIIYCQQIYIKGFFYLASKQKCKLKDQSNTSSPILSVIFKKIRMSNSSNQYGDMVN